MGLELGSYLNLKKCKKQNQKNAGPAERVLPENKCPFVNT